MTNALTSTTATPRSARTLPAPPPRMLGALLVVAACVAPGRAHARPTPQTSAVSWLVVDADSGTTLGEHNANARREPASLTKLMTAYLAFDALERGTLRWDETVAVSAGDIASVGSDEARMYLTPGQHVRVRDLVRGLIVASANDAALVLAKRIGGSPAGFAARMNDTARRLGMRDSHFVSPSGITTPDHYSTAHDLSILAQHLNRDFPAFYAFSSQRRFAYGTFSKTNKNRLLSTDPTVDGMKTGHTNAAGWCMVVTAERRIAGSRALHRVIAVLLGEPTEKQRLADAGKLLDWGFASLGGGESAASTATAATAATTATTAATAAAATTATAAATGARRSNARAGEHRAEDRAHML
ncbi:D-alanyl-D-alanine carboxypeptidase family protein [Burkholderia savannae]|uniref:D-alanyl-D-alanine carboxypeptidase family protein n=1 Tax=Burkholderia TaxID=32008 RepID=UPI00075E41AB|nr:peptidase M15 [Burkholderia savannae]KVG37157.1 peptidase M15 [Burkholderia sp. MSMB0265]KVG77782.1 peptidase M15 [Burkholderia sp. MSMB2040]KVG94216.1 peptidase M15 [Burkholderia sp. MSMB2042]KVG97700.1 peptidase M15 [Burkholderia sp. MSMB2041]